MSSKETKGIVESNFTRKSFYVKPPSPGSSKAEWEAWLREDNRKAAADKARYTKSFNHAEIPERFQSNVLMRGPNGAWRQSPAIGFSGDWENGQGQLEVVDQPGQERAAVMSAMGVEKHKPSTKSSGKSRRRRKNRRKRKKQSAKA